MLRRTLISEYAKNLAETIYYRLMTRDMDADERMQNRDISEIRVGINQAMRDQAERIYRKIKEKGENAWDIRLSSPGLSSAERDKIEYLGNSLLKLAEEIKIDFIDGR